MPVVRGGAKEIDGQRIGRRGVEIHHVARSPGRDVLQNIRRQVPVRVDEGDAPPVLDVLQDEIAEQGRLAGSCLPYDIDMLAPGWRVD